MKKYVALGLGRAKHLASLGARYLSPYTKTLGLGKIPSTPLPRHRIGSDPLQQLLELRKIPSFPPIQTLKPRRMDRYISPYINALGLGEIPSSPPYRLLNLEKQVLGLETAKHLYESSNIAFFLRKGPETWKNFKLRDLQLRKNTERSLEVRLERHETRSLFFSSANKSQRVICKINFFQNSMSQA